MSRPKADAGKIDTHVYLAAEVHKHLTEVAAEECRSVTSQIEYFIRQGLKRHDEGRHSA